MNTFMLIVEVVIVLLLLWAIIIIVKNPKEIFIGLPVFMFHRVVEKILTLIKLITSPIWFPIYLLDSAYNCGIFELKFFKFFNRYDSVVENNKPDTSYKQQDEILIDYVFLLTLTFIRSDHIDKCHRLFRHLLIEDFSKNG